MYFPIVLTGSILPSNSKSNEVLMNQVLKNDQNLIVISRSKWIKKFLLIDFCAL